MTEPISLTRLAKQIRGEGFSTNADKLRLIAVQEQIPLQTAGHYAYAAAEDAERLRAAYMAKHARPVRKYAARAS